MDKVLKWMLICVSCVVGLFFLLIIIALIAAISATVKSQEHGGVINGGTSKGAGDAPIEKNVVNNEARAEESIGESNVMVVRAPDTGEIISRVQNKADMKCRMGYSTDISMFNLSTTMTLAEVCKIDGAELTDCRPGSEEGENVRYFYCDTRGIVCTKINSDGTIESIKYYSLKETIECDAERIANAEGLAKVIDAMATICGPKNDPVYGKFFIPC